MNLLVLLLSRCPFHFFDRLFDHHHTNHPDHLMNTNIISSVSNSHTIDLSNSIYINYSLSNIIEDQSRNFERYK